jgi:hypothetical protein
MTRPISVVAAVLVLLAVGWYVGNRPAATLREQIARERAYQAERLSRYEERLGRAQMEVLLWQASAELLTAAGQARDHDFGSASRSAGRALDLLTRAGGQPGAILEVGEQRDAVEAALGRLAALDTKVYRDLEHVAEDIAHLLERSGRA